MRLPRPSLIGCLLALPLAAHAQSPESSERCHDQRATADIVNCLVTVTAAADKHLNAAYQRALKAVDPSGVPALRAAERGWLEYRDQRCRYLSAGDGTIMRIVAASCTATMTKARADELDEDAKGVGQ